MRVLSHWDRRFLCLARHISEWSKDPSTKVGAVLARGKEFIAPGYNGFPEGIADTEERLNDRDLKYPLMIHAERNALRVAGRDKARDASIYLWPFMPCVPCAMEIIACKVREVIAPANDNPRWQKDFALATELFGEAGVRLVLVRDTMQEAA